MDVLGHEDVTDDIELVRLHMNGGTQHIIQSCETVLGIGSESAKKWSETSGLKVFSVLTQVRF